MSNKNYQVYFDCGSSKIRAGAFNKYNPSECYYKDSKFFTNYKNLEYDIQEIITYLEKSTSEYLNDVSLMIDSPQMLSIGVSVSNKLDGSKLNKEDVQFLIQQAKQQILRNYKDQNIVHIIIDNYKINDIEYMFLPDEIKCDLLSIDIIFICIPKKIIEYFKNIFLKLDISIKQILCTSYAKSLYYKENIFKTDNVSFIDVGLNKTSIIFYIKDKINFLCTIPIGGNHITKDIFKILKVSPEQAEDIKLNFDQNKSFLKKKKIPIDLVQKIILSRTDEILELCSKTIKLNLKYLDKFKMVLMGDGSKILDNQYKDQISFPKEIDFLEETVEDICQGGLKMGEGYNKQEVVMVPKKPIKQGFFEKLFHFFR